MDFGTLWGGFRRPKSSNLALFSPFLLEKSYQKSSGKKNIDFGGQDGDFGGQEADFGGQREGGHPFPWTLEDKKDSPADRARPLAKLESGEFSLELRKVSYACHP